MELKQTGLVELLSERNTCVLYHRQSGARVLRVVEKEIKSWKGES